MKSVRANARPYVGTQCARCCARYTSSWSNEWLFRSTSTPTLPTTLWPTDKPVEDTRATLDAMMGREAGAGKGADTSGTIRIKHAKPKGSTLMHGKPTFKDVADNRQTVMPSASDGPAGWSSWRDTLPGVPH
jgi:hypothetical protein